MLPFLVAIHTHVPGYECENNCCHPKYNIANVDSPDDAISQAQYLVNDGGLELDIADFKHAIDAGPGQLVYVDAVFRDEIDRKEYDLYIGCGGCAPGDEVFETSLVPFEGYGSGHLEPFTQHHYRSFFVDSWRTFNTTALATCTSKHWSIRLKRSSESTAEIYWSAVVGRREWFSFIDLLEYPLFVLRNHGASWNEMEWTFPTFVVLSFALITLLILYSYGGLYMCCATRVYRVNSDLQPAPYFYKRDFVFMIRSYMYFVASVAIVADIFESLYHCIHALGKVNASPNEVFAYLGLVLFIGKIVPLLILAWIWDSMRRWDKTDWLGTWCLCGPCYGKDSRRFRCCTCCPCFNDPLYAHVGWAPLEIATGLSFFFLFGLGFYAAPAAITIAGIARLSDFQYVQRGSTIVVDGFPVSEQDDGEEKRVALPLLALGSDRP